MNIKSQNKDTYQYRGISYQKNTSHKYPINVSAYQQNSSSQPLETATLSYRGVAYTIPKQNYLVDFSLSAYVQKYRGAEYLTCLTSLSLDDKHY